MVGRLLKMNNVTSQYPSKDILTIMDVSWTVSQVFLNPLGWVAKRWGFVFLAAQAGRVADASGLGQARVGGMRGSRVIHKALVMNSVTLQYLTTSLDRSAASTAIGRPTTLVSAMGNLNFLPRSAGARAAHVRRWNS